MKSTTTLMIILWILIKKSSEIFSRMLDISTVIKRTVLLFVQRRPVGMAPWEKFDPSDQPVIVKPCPPCKHPVRRYAGATLCTAELYVFEKLLHRFFKL